jgi:hypothetical protein
LLILGMSCMRLVRLSGIGISCMWNRGWMARCLRMLCTDSAVGEKIFGIPVAEIEAIVEPDSIADDVRRESVTSIGIHPPILAILET